MNRFSRNRARGVTLIEVMIVVVIMGLIAAGAAMAVYPNLEKGRKQTTVMAARTIRNGTREWRTQHSDACPSPELLVSEKILERGTKLTDAWDSPFKIICEEDDATVISFGPDRKEGTPDDLKVPEQT